MNTENRVSQWFARRRRSPPAGARAALAHRDAGAHVLRRHARSPDGGRAGRGRGRPHRLGRGLVQLPDGRRRASRAAGGVRARAAGASAAPSPRGGLRRAHREDGGARDPVGRARAARACIAGIDIALWDLEARRAGQPLWKLLAARGARTAACRSMRADSIPTAPRRPRRATPRAHARSSSRSASARSGTWRTCDALRAASAPTSTLMVDANQAWSLERRAAMAPRLAPFTRVARGAVARRHAMEGVAGVAAQCGVPLAAGENLASRAAFDGRSLRGARRSCSPTSRSGAASPDAFPWRGASSRPGCVSARTSSAAASGCSPPPTCSRRGRRRPARDRRQPESVAHAPLPRACDIERRADRARCGARPRHRSRPGRIARDVRAAPRTIRSERGLGRDASPPPSRPCSCSSARFRS